MSRVEQAVDLTGMFRGRAVLAGFVGIASLGALGACSSKGAIFSTSSKLGADGGGGRPPPAGQGGAASTPSPTATATAYGTGGTFLSGFPGREAGACGTFPIDPKAIPPAPYLLLLIDTSAGMDDAVAGGTWWSTTQTGIVDFVEHSPNALVSVGVQYFPLPGMTSSCDADYGNADVELAPLQDAANAIVLSLANCKHGGGSPLGPALKGALAHMKTWATSHPMRPYAVVVLARESMWECAPAALSSIAAVAADAVKQEPRIATYVIGLGRDVLGEVAVAGGTKAATVIADDVSAGVTRALSTIAGGCTYVVPKPSSGHTLNASLASAGSTPSTPVPRLNGPGECTMSGENGWYFDDARGVTAITFCPNTCATLRYSTIEIYYGPCSAAP